MKRHFKTTVFLMLGWLGMIPAMAMSQEAVRIVEGPKDMPHVSAEMRTPEYWINRLAQPDRVLCTPEQIVEQEARWITQGLCQNVFELPESLRKFPLTQLLKRDFSYLERVGRYDAEGRRLTPDDYGRIRKNVNLDGVQVSNPVRWGLTVRRTGLRLFPNRDMITSKPHDLEFNVMLHTGMRLAEPVAVLHVSRDQNWYFVMAGVGYGWVAAEDVALSPDKQTVAGYCTKAKDVVVAGQVGFMDAAGRLLPVNARMGCQIARTPQGTGTYDLPVRDQAGRLGWIAVKPAESAAVLETARPLTPRCLIEQAFLLLDEPYGWGGGSGYGDCSELIRRIGLACGVDFPRSTEALKAGLTDKVLAAERGARKAQLANLEGGAALLYMPGHIMLVLGTVDGRTYVIHNLYGIHAQDAAGAYIRRVARVLVSELSLGAGSRKGSLQTRISHVLEIAAGIDK